MAKNLVPVAQWATNITVPTDGDSRNAASIEPGFQSVADRLEYLRRLSETYAHYTISGSNVAANSKFTINQTLQGALTFSFLSNEIGFPVTGRYRIDITGEAACSSATNPSVFGIGISYQSTLVGRAESTRFSTNTAHVVGFSGHHVINATNTSDRVSFVSTASNVTLDTLCFVTVTRIG